MALNYKTEIWHTEFQSKQTLIGENYREFQLKNVLILSFSQVDKLWGCMTTLNVH